MFVADVFKRQFLLRSRSNSLKKNDDFGGGGEWALKVDAHRCEGIRVGIQVADILASQEVQLIRGEIERGDNATVKCGIRPRGDMIRSGRCSGILDRRFDSDVSAFVFVELADPVGKPRRGNKWTGKIDLRISVRSRLVPGADGCGVKLADGRHCVCERVGVLKSNSQSRLYSVVFRHELQGQESCKSISAR